MKKPILVLLCILMVPVTVSALQTEELVAIAAMPLAVAAVADLTGVPTADLFNLVATMNNAQVPATQFIEVVRYAPVALVDTNEPFVPYITSQVDRGVRGEALAIAMEDRIETYEGADTINVVSPPRVVAYDYDYLYPPVVVTRFQPVRFDPLALVAMPLAVAAVSEITDVPVMQLASLAALLNQARMPPAQFVEVVRYSPVALIDPDPQFLTFVTTEIGDGRRGLVLARSIEDRYHLLGVDEIDLVDPPAIVIEREAFLPPVVRTRIATARNHPHGGPPGQLKKELGLQTGAEVVHGTHPGRSERAAARGSSGKTRGARVTGNRESDRVKARGNSGKSGKSGKAVTRGRSDGGGKGVAKAKRGNAEQHVDRGRPMREQKQVRHERGNGKSPQGGGGGKANAGKKGKG